MIRLGSLLRLSIFFWMVLAATASAQPGFTPRSYAAGLGCLSVITSAIAQFALDQGVPLSRLPRQPLFGYFDEADVLLESAGVSVKDREEIARLQRSLREAISLEPIFKQTLALADGSPQRGDLFVGYIQGLEGGGASLLPNAFSLVDDVSLELMRGLQDEEKIPARIAISRPPLAIVVYDPKKFKTGINQSLAQTLTLLSGSALYRAQGTLVNWVIANQARKARNQWTDALFRNFVLVDGEKIHLSRSFVSAYTVGIHAIVLSEALDILRHEQKASGQPARIGAPSDVELFFQSMVGKDRISDADLVAIDSTQTNVLKRVREFDETMRATIEAESKK